MPEKQEESEEGYKFMKHQRRWNISILLSEDKGCHPYSDC